MRISGRLANSISWHCHVKCPPNFMSMNFLFYVWLCTVRVARWSDRRGWEKGKGKGERGECALTYCSLNIFLKWLFRFFSWPNSPFQFSGKLGPARVNNFDSIYTLLWQEFGPPTGRGKELPGIGWMTGRKVPGKSARHLAFNYLRIYFCVVQSFV